MAIPPYIPPAPGPSGGTDTIHADGKKAPPPPRSDPAAEELIRGSLSRFGGRLLRRKDRFDLGVITFAVETAGNGAYLAESQRIYRRFNREELPLVRLSECSELGSYTLFDFEIHPGELSLTECLHSEAAKDPKPYDVLTALISLLDRMQQGKDRAAYTPLSCLSLDTVFFNTETGAIRVLPLRGLPGRYPATSAPESGTARAEIRSDLFDAVTVYRQLLSRDPGMPLSLKTTNLTLHNCTQNDPADRPDFLEVRNVVLDRTAEPSLPAQTGDPSFGQKLSGFLNGCINWFYKVLNIRKPGESDQESTATFATDVHENGG